MRSSVRSYWAILIWLTPMSYETAEDARIVPSRPRMSPRGARLTQVTVRSALALAASSGPETIWSQAVRPAREVNPARPMS